MADQQSQSQGMDQDNEPNVTPEEQELYDNFVGNALNALYSEETTREALNTIKVANSTIKGVAIAAVNLADHLYQKAKEQGVNIPDSVLSHGGYQIIDAIIELAETAKVIPKVSDDDRFRIQTLAESLWREKHPEMINQEQEQQTFNNISPDQIRQVASQMGGR